VKDTGIGMPSDKAERIFDRFYKLEESPSRIFGGAGLGLSITKHLVNLLGGEVWVNSQKGNGSVFYFTLPYELASPVPGIPNSSYNEGWPAKENVFKDMQILIVEDDDMNILLLQKMLHITGASIFVAKNGLEAIRRVEENPGISIILMDVKMPGMDGYEATRRIKKKYPAIKIIMQTAYAIAGENEKAFEAGADDYISKPLNKYDLFNKMKEVKVRKSKST
jgi:CheY-like chemotaxis protein